MIKFETDSPKIAIVKASQLGEMLCAIPAIRALKTAMPKSKITLIGLPWAKSFVERFKTYFDDFIPFLGFPTESENANDNQEWEQFVQHIKQVHFDYIIQMNGNGQIENAIMEKLEARHIAGFDIERSYVDALKFIDNPGNLNEVERNLILMESLGFALVGNHLEFPLYEKDEKDFQSLLLPVLPHRYVCLHPGSRGRIHQWPPIYFAALADYCIEQGLIVIVTGAADEMDVTREVIKSMKHTPIDLTGKTSLGAMALLIKNAGLLICNCTGVSQIAAAFQTPSVVINMDKEAIHLCPAHNEIHQVTEWNADMHFEKIFEQTSQIVRRLMKIFAIRRPGKNHAA